MIPNKHMKNTPANGWSAADSGIFMAQDRVVVQLVRFVLTGFPAEQGTE
mgnify:CR=1 FL=1